MRMCFVAQDPFSPSQGNKSRSCYMPFHSLSQVSSIRSFEIVMDLLESTSIFCKDVGIDIAMDVLEIEVVDY